MNLFALFAGRIEAVLAQLKSEGVLPPHIGFGGITAEPPRESAHGDVATNAAMVLAKAAGLQPRALAETIAARLRGTQDVGDVEVAGPGFINIRLVDSFWPKVVRAILESGPDYGRTDAGGGERVNVEYVSANPTGPLHVGHGRGAVFGDALANLLAFAGFDVTREYYINDAGAQVEVLARSAYVRYREALGEDIGDIPEGLYPGDYLKAVGKALADEFGTALVEKAEADWLPIVQAAATETMMAAIRDDLAALGIAHDVFFSERSLTQGGVDRVAATIAELRQAGLVYEGRLAPPKGKRPEDWEDREQILFQATRFGDDVDRPLIKSDGSYTYFAADMAYHRDKVRRGFKSLIDVWGADHGGYVKRVKAAVEALSGGEVEVDVKLCQLVRLLRGGEPVKMSKRAGEFVTLREVVDEVGPDPVRFMMLYRKNDATLDFDFEKVTEQSRDNPVFYVQYAHARAHSVFRNVRETFSDLEADTLDPGAAALGRLTDPAELGLMRRLAYYPRVLEGAAFAHEPHRVAFYLYDLASEFHGLWTRGKELPQLRFINSADRELTVARVALIKAVAEVLASGLGILGVQAIREMR